MEQKAVADRCPPTSFLSSFLISSRSFIITTTMQAVGCVYIDIQDLFVDLQEGDQTLKREYSN